jgi:RimJ/RimL family protein N-acetyltransferase
MFKIVDAVSGASVDSVGWMVVPEFQGRGIAVGATAQAIELARG